MAAPKGNKYAVGNEGGAPTLYTKKHAEQAYKLCLLGATDAEMADIFGIVESTLNLWKLKHKEFSESIKRGKSMADANVADRLYQRAMGFEHDSEEIKVVSDGQGNGSSIERVAIRKVYPPDTTAAIFWLKNRQPKAWRDKQEVDHTTKGESINQKPPDLSMLTDEELRIRAEIDRKIYAP